MEGMAPSEICRFFYHEFLEFFWAGAPKQAVDELATCTACDVCRLPLPDNSPCPAMTSEVYCEALNDQWPKMRSFFCELDDEDPQLVP
jgi:hypothetical protein